MAASPDWAVGLPRTTRPPSSSADDVRVAGGPLCPAMALRPRSAHDGRAAMSADGPAAVFVYGTLMPGRLRWPLIELQATGHRPAAVPGRLFDTGQGWPAALFDDGCGHHRARRAGGAPPRVARRPAGRAGPGRGRRHRPLRAGARDHHRRRRGLGLVHAPGHEPASPRSTPGPPSTSADQPQPHARSGRPSGTVSRRHHVAVLVPDPDGRRVGALYRASVELSARSRAGRSRDSGRPHRRLGTAIERRPPDRPQSDRDLGDRPSGPRADSVVNCTAKPSVAPQLASSGPQPEPVASSWLRSAHRATGPDQALGHVDEVDAVGTRRRSRSPPHT